MFVIFDLDGTLSDHSARLPLVLGEKKDYTQYYDQCHEDPPMIPIIEIMRALLLQGHRVEIWTGRTDRVREKTIAWLASQCLPTYPLRHMRQEGDFTPDYQLKGQWLAAEEIKPALVFEDRPRMVEWWRSQNILCCDVGGGQ